MLKVRRGPTDNHAQTTRRSRTFGVGDQDADIGRSAVDLKRDDGVRMNVTIRVARRDDVNALGRVHVRAWQAAYRGVMPDEYLDALDPTDRALMWARFFERAPSDRQLKVVTVDGDVVGFSCFGACADSGDGALGELFAINLDPDHWGRGLGRKLLSTVHDELATFGDEAVLWVVPANARARGVYESAGWTDDGGRRHDEVLGAQVDEMRYRITLQA